MKKYLYLLLLLLTFVSCSKKVEISVFNNSEVDRVNEMVEICLCQLQNFDATKIIILDSDGKRVPCQIIYKGTNKPESMIFPVNLEAGKQTVFTVKEGKPEQIPTKTFARFVPDRKNDIAWENDKIAFRMYGQGLAKENPTNGVDVWLKRTNNLILSKQDRKNSINETYRYNDSTAILDGYKVGNTLGAGGVALYYKDSLLIGKYFNRCKVLDNGPLRSSFVLFYDKIPYGSKFLKAELVITLDAGSNLNEGIVKYSGDAANLQLAVGLCLHDSVQSINGNAEKGYLGYAENVFKEIDNRSVALGRCFTGVVFSDKVLETKQLAGHVIGICKYNIGEEFRFFFGAGWNKHGFPSDQDWYSYLVSKRSALLQPLEVKILK